MKFPYLKLPLVDPRLKWVARPYIQIKLTGTKGSRIGYALIDSGADRCLFNSEIAKKIGLDLTNAPDEFFGGIEGGGLKAKLYKVKIQIVGMSEDIEVVAGFVESSGVTAILGQDGFFDNFKIQFNKSKGFLEINLIV